MCDHCESVTTRFYTNPNTYANPNANSYAYSNCDANTNRDPYANTSGARMQQQLLGIHRLCIWTDMCQRNLPQQRV